MKIKNYVKAFGISEIYVLLGSDRGCFGLAYLGWSWSNLCGWFNFIWGDCSYCFKGEYILWKGEIHEFDDNLHYTSLFIIISI